MVNLLATILLLAIAVLVGKWAGAPINDSVQRPIREREAQTNAAVQTVKDENVKQLEITQKWADEVIKSSGRRQSD